MYARHENVHPKPTKAERLFDSVFGGKTPHVDEEEDDPPIVIKPSRTYVHKHQDHSLKKTTKRKKNKPANVRFQENAEVNFVTPNHKNRKPTSKYKRGNNYTKCTKETVEAAFERANLPDFDLIAQHELYVSKEDPTARHQVKKSDTPPLAELLRPFEDLVDWRREGLSTPPTSICQSIFRKPLTHISTNDIRESGIIGSSFVELEKQTTKHPRTKVYASTPLRNGVAKKTTPNMKTRRNTRSDKESQCTISPSQSVSRCPIRTKYAKASISPSIRLPRNENFIQFRSRRAKVLMSTPLREPVESEQVVNDLSTIVQPTELLIPNMNSVEFDESDSLKLIQSRNHTLKSSINKGPSIEHSSRLSDAVFKTPPQSIFDQSNRQRTILHTRLSFGTSRRLTIRNETKLDANITRFYSAHPSHATRINDTHGFTKNCTARTFASNRRRITVDPTNNSFGKSRHESQSKEITSLLQNSFAAAFRETRVVLEDGNEEVLTAQDKVIALCSPQAVTSFSEIFTGEVNKNLVKIGEGSYGEIYKSTDSNGNEVVLKLVPCSLEMDVEDAFVKLLPEIKVASSFNQLRINKFNQTPNFIHMKRVACLQGGFPQKLIDEWDKFDEAKQSENIDPREYGNDHLHVVMLLNNGGHDLEQHVFANAEEAWSIFVQVALSLAAAECEYQFEHRDLHWGNILIKDTPDNELNYMVDGRQYAMKSSGVLASIIDFTLSRISKDGLVVYDDLSIDDDLFTGKGDYQFEVYRMMKSENGNNWESFTPKTNIFWLHYLLDKLINSKKYRSRSKAHRNCLCTLKSIQTKLLNFASAQNLVESDLFSEYINA